ncbi:Esterase A [[Actinomadura] parvosata subsp. kistnae]|uniref:Esterase n=1 Tax=[Actinomadura] parvosata subsp. kistnae TaxID=1909395 RepID=A0A1V0A6S3_9ACTN|nr:serine hydrolase domain-containing protein [Nonomuraea sp. ATCC 55076]AQZ65916.1 esterase [Nonomuraea sp. ATCC 55076]SPL97368.1 Esterase A [Actinomadura parvosata subsp. kistnae]
MHCDPRFSRVREVFERHFADGEELGAAFAVYLDGELVVDLWGGVADRHTGRPWERDTPVFAYSCTKAVTAAVLLQLAERGLVDVTAPVAEVWPEFAANGKAGITVEHVLTHQAGLPALEEPVPVEEFEDQPAIAARLARQAPLWEPGTAHGYHALTYGFLVGEVVRRVTGKSVGELVSAEIAGPLGLELWVGAPDPVIERTARLTAGERGRLVTTETPPPGAQPDGEMADGAAADGAVADGAAAGGPERTTEAVAEMTRLALDPGSLMNRALGNPAMNLLKGGANNPVILRAGWPAAGMVTTARGLAGFYRALIAGEILRPETLQDALRPRVKGPDRTLYLGTSFGLGFMRPSMTFMVRSPSAFGHSGAGGSIGVGDPERGLAIAYVMNKMASAISGNLRGHRLLQAVYDSL